MFTQEIILFKQNCLHRVVAAAALVNSISLKLFSIEEMHAYLPLFRVYVSVVVCTYPIAYIVLKIITAICCCKTVEDNPVVELANPE